MSYHSYRPRRRFVSIKACFGMVGLFYTPLPLLCVSGGAVPGISRAFAPDMPAVSANEIDRLQLANDFTLRYAATFHAMPGVASKIPTVATYTVTISARQNVVLFETQGKEKIGGKEVVLTDVLITDGQKTYFRSGRENRMYICPGMYLGQMGSPFAGRAPVPLPGVGIPHLPLLRSPPTAVPHPATAAPNAFLCDLAVPNLQSYLKAGLYTRGIVEAEQDHGQLRLRRTRLDSTEGPFQQWTFAHHQLFQGCLVPAWMRWERFSPKRSKTTIPAPILVCDFVLAEAGTAPLSPDRFDPLTYLRDTDQQGGETAILFNDGARKVTFYNVPGRGTLEEQAARQAAFVDAAAAKDKEKVKP